jgi:hypothetical protein
MIRYFPDGIYTAGRRERLPFGLADDQQVPMSSGLPGELQAVVTKQDGTQVATLSAPMRNEGLPRAYYPFEIELPEAGVYTLATNVEGAELSALFSLAAPGSLSLPGPGDELPGFDTPTTADARGVNPLCTRPEACPFHTQTLTEALAAGGPVAYLIGTPAHCQTGICGPVLDLLIDASKDFPAVTYVHAEVFADDAATTPAPAVTTLGLEYEPLLFLVGADGKVQRRLDVIYDVAELRDALSALGT